MQKLNNNIINEDLEHILFYTKELWSELKNKSIFITGGTGFFGTWFLETFVYLNKKLKLNANILILTRNYEAFVRKAPHIVAHNCVNFIVGDIKTFEYPKKNFDFIIHLATTSAEETFNNEDALKKFENVFYGTRNVLNFAVKCNAKKFLYTSSGAVYGDQPLNISNITESYLGAPDVNDFCSSALGEAKRAAEFLCSYYATKYKFEVKIARCFSFVGPYLQLNIHYAIGNFIYDAICKKKITINSDGMQERAYMYMSDLMIWLWTILFKGKSCSPYNVGSENMLTIAELSNLVANCFKEKIDIKILKKMDKKTSASNRYIPSTQKAQKELNLKETIDLQTAIQKTICYFNNREC